MGLNLNTILELFGLRTDTANVEVREGRDKADGGITMVISRPATNATLQQQAAVYGGVAALELGAILTPDEARYLAERLTAIAGKVEAKVKAKAPCDGCGK